MSDVGKFVLSKKTSFEELKSIENVELPESDLCFQDKENIYQFKYEQPEDNRRFEIKPGFYVFTEGPGGAVPIKTSFREANLLDTIDNTSSILKEAKTFFSRLHIYDIVKRPKKRGVLLYSKPGLGKTSAISKLCRDFYQEDKGTVIINWPTSEVRAEDVAKFLNTQSEYQAECTRLVLVIEDIGGSERDNEGHRSQVHAGLLNLLDGVDVVFKLPTFIIATTNHPENLLESLADRPGRFDLMIELQPPSSKEKVLLTEFIAKRELTDEEKSALSMKGSENFSIAHLEEIVVRSLLHDKSIPEVVKELIEHSEKFKQGFEKKKSIGMGRRGGLFD